MDERKEERIAYGATAWTRFGDKLSTYMYLSNGNIAITIPILVDEEWRFREVGVVCLAENCRARMNT